MTALCDIWSVIWCVRSPVDKHTASMAHDLIMDLEFCAVLTVKGPKISIDSREYGASRATRWCDCCVLWMVWLVRLNLKRCCYDLANSLLRIRYEYAMVVVA